MGERLALAGDPASERELLRSQLAQLELEVQRLAHRVGRLEAAGSPAPGMVEAEPAALPLGALPEEAQPSPSSPRGFAIPSELTHVGRLLLVLAGGFLLRSATDAGMLQPALGVVLGFAYAIAWLPAARRARRREGSTAAFHALATVALAYPLLFEATQRFHVLGPGTGALALAGLTALLLHTAWHQRSPAIGWLLMAATTASAASLAVVSRAPAPFAALLVGFAGAALALGEHRGWRLLSLVSAVVADLATAIVTFGAALPHSRQPPAAALCVQLSLLAVHFGLAAALAVRSRRPGWPLLCQLATAMSLGWGGAVATAAGHPGLAASVGSLGVVLAALTQAFALKHLAGTPSPLRRLLLAAAVLFAVGGTALLLPSPAASWAVLGLLATTLGARTGLDEVELQGALLAGAAALGSGALAAASASLLLPATAPSTWSAVALFAMLALGLCLAPLSIARPRDRLLHHAAAALLLLLASWGSAGALATLLAAPLGGDPGLRSAVGTGLLAVIATLLARLGRRSRLPAAAWLVYPLLVGTTLKLVLVDLPHGRPFTLFLSLAALGGALLAAARAARSPAEG